MGGSDVQKVDQAVVIAALPQHTSPHYVQAMACDKAPQESKVKFLKHKFSRHKAPICTGHTGKLNNPLQLSRVRGGG